MATNADILLRILTRYDGKGLESTLTDLDKIGQRAEKTGKMLSARLTLPLAGVGLLSLKAAADFDRAFNEVNSLLDISAEEVERLRQGVRDLSKDLGTDLISTTQGLYNAISAGVPPDNVLTFMEVASRAAIAGVTDVNTSVDLLTSVLNAYKLETSQAQAVSDQLFATVKAGKTNFPELAASIGQVAPLAASADVELSQLLGSIATLTKQGVATPQAVTQIRAAITSLLAPSDTLAGVYDQLGLASGRQLIQQEGLAGALDIVRNAIGDNDSQLKVALGSIEAFNGLLGLTGESATTAATDLDAVTDSAGATSDAFDKIDQGSARALDKMTAAITEIRIGLAESGLTDVLERIAELVQIGADNFAELPGPVRESVVELGALAALAGPMLLLVGAGAKGVTTFVSLAQTTVKLGKGLQSVASGMATARTASIATTAALSTQLGLMVALAAASYAVTRAVQEGTAAWDAYKEAQRTEDQDIRTSEKRIAKLAEEAKTLEEINYARKAAAVALQLANKELNSGVDLDDERRSLLQDQGAAMVAIIRQLDQRKPIQEAAVEATAAELDNLEKQLDVRKELTAEQITNREELATQIRLLELRAAGDEEGVKALERRLAIQELATSLEEDYGAEREDALATAERMIALEEQATAKQEQKLIAERKRREEEERDKARIARADIAAEHAINIARLAGEDEKADGLEYELRLRQGIRNLMEQYDYDERAATEIVKARLALRREETKEIADQQSELEKLVEAARADGANVGEARLAGKGTQYTINGQVVGNTKDGLNTIGTGIAEDYSAGGSEVDRRNRAGLASVREKAAGASGSTAAPNAPQQPGSSTPVESAQAINDKAQEMVAGIEEMSSRILASLENVLAAFSQFAADNAQRHDDLAATIRNQRN